MAATNAASVPSQAFASGPSEEGIVGLRAGRVRLRHQPPAAFHLSYAGDRPVLLYVFRAPLRGRTDAHWVAGSYCMLQPGRTAELHHADPVEVLAVGYDGVRERRVASVRAPAWEAVDPGVQAIAHEIRRVLRREPDVDLRYVEALAETLLVRAARAAVAIEAPAAAPLQPYRLRRLLAYLDANLGRNIAVAELAAEVGLSRAHLTRAFQAATGETPARFVMGRRLEQVKAALGQGATDLALLAAQCGFSSHAHMTSAFRSVFGLTPSAYRRRLVDAAPPPRRALGDSASQDS